MRKDKLDHWMLIDAMRMKDVLLISDIFRIFPDAVDLSEAASPLDMLRSFVRVYGLEFGVEELPFAKMFERITLPKGADDIRYHLPRKSQIELSVAGTSWRYVGDDRPAGVPPAQTSIIAAYTVDLDRYMKDRIRYLGR